MYNIFGENHKCHKIFNIAFIIFNIFFILFYTICALAFFFKQNLIIESES